MNITISESIEAKKVFRVNSLIFPPHFPNVVLHIFWQNVKHFGFWKLSVQGSERLLIFQRRLINVCLLDKIRLRDYRFRRIENVLCGLCFFRSDICLKNWLLITQEWHLLTEFGKVWVFRYRRLWVEPFVLLLESIGIKCVGFTISYKPKLLNLFWLVHCDFFSLELNIQIGFIRLWKITIWIDTV